jgi:thiamine pyrophosphokinase
MRAVIFANGVMDQWPAGLTLSPGHDLIIAADGGLHHCLKWGAAPGIVVGDLDSVDPDDLAKLDGTHTETIRHPVRKDETDLELALKLAVHRGVTDIAVLGALGARWDMTFSNVLLLGAAFLKETTVCIFETNHELTCLRGGRCMELHGRPGDLLSLLPLTGDAAGVTLQGFEYPLENTILPLGSTLGVSNVFSSRAPATVELKEGLLLIMITRQQHQTPS